MNRPLKSEPRAVSAGKHVTVQQLRSIFQEFPDLNTLAIEVRADGNMYVHDERDPCLGKERK